jgi:hypothetical protein
MATRRQALAADGWLDGPGMVHRINAAAAWLCL